MSDENRPIEGYTPATLRASLEECLRELFKDQGDEELAAMADYFAAEFDQQIRQDTDYLWLKDPRGSSHAASPTERLTSAALDVLFAWQWHDENPGSYDAMASVEYREDLLEDEAAVFLRKRGYSVTHV